MSGTRNHRAGDVYWVAWGDTAIHHGVLSQGRRVSTGQPNFRAFGRGDRWLDHLQELDPSFRVQINRDPAETLRALPGVGASTAESIIDGRPYDTVDDLTRVSGIGESTLDEIRDYVAAGER